MKRLFYCFTVATAFLFLASCSGSLDSGNAHRGAIVLGDSSTIVTERDTSFLSDQVADIEPQQLFQQDSQVQQPSTPEEKTPAKQPEPVPTPAVANAFTIDFGQGVQVSFPGIQTRSFQQQNPEKDAGVSYAITSGNLSNGNLTVTGLKNIRIRQRYQSSLQLKSKGETLSLQNMGDYLSDWQSLSGSGKTFRLSSLQDVNYKSVSHNTIRNGVRSSAHSSRLSRQKTNFWLDAIRRTRSANDAPCQIKLENVQWQISGETASGRSFHKTIRLEP